MRILHTSDWHLGRTLCGRKRHDEFEAFLGWLSRVIRDERVDVLLVAGDVFDTGTPGSRAQELYYRFLCDAAASPCRHVVVTAGNHDSPAFLEAPGELLKILNVHISGTSGDPSREVLELDGADGGVSLVVCAVPYLRDRDVRTSEAGESMEDKDSRLVQGIIDHYDAVTSMAAARLAELEKNTGARIPLVVTGHLFTSGGRSADAERDLYVGTLARIPPEAFRRCAEPDYVALGHLHIPQTVGGDDRIRYSGSPIPMSFGESRQEKFVNIVDLDGGRTAVRAIPVPVFRRIERVRGSLAGIEEAIASLGGDGGEIWLEVVHDGPELAGDLRGMADEAAKRAGNLHGSNIEVLRVRDDAARNSILSRLHSGETLDGLDPREIFRRFLVSSGVPEAEWEGLMRTHDEALLELESQDRRGDDETGGIGE
jgi:exonuclease SbcD